MKVIKTFDEFLNENQLSLFNMDDVKKDPYGGDNIRTEKETRFLPQLKKAIDKEVKKTFGNKVKWKYNKDPERISWNDDINGSRITFNIQITSTSGKYSKGKSIEVYGSYILDAGRSSDKKPGRVNFRINKGTKHDPKILAIFEDLFMDIPWTELKGDPFFTPNFWDDKIDEDQFLDRINYEYSDRAGYSLFGEVYNKYINKYKKVNKIGLLGKLGLRR